MARLHCLLPRLLAPVLAAGLCAPSLSARPNGYAAECGGCHYGELEGGGRTPPPNVFASVAGSRVEPGEQVDISVTVESTWPDAVVAGFLILGEAEGGVFTPSEEGTGNVGTVEGQALDYAIGHTAARALADSTATFQSLWTAPMTAGAVRLRVYGVTSDDGDGMDDPGVTQERNDAFGKSELTLGVGCDLVTYYYDGDMDGYGEVELLSCDPPTGYVLQGGDCADDNPAVNPGAAEECSFADENCDGERMAPPGFYRDVDGDGYGEASDIVVDTCILPEGYATEGGDCAPNDPGIHPGAIELPGNVVDDNCNGMIDEPAVTPVGTGGAGPIGAGGSPVAPGGQLPGMGGSADLELAPTAPASAEMPAVPGVAEPVGTQPGDMGGGASGCGIVSSQRSGWGGALGLLLFCAGLNRRRIALR